VKYSFIIFFLTLSFISSAQNDICPLKVGETIPKITLQDFENKETDLAKLCQKPTVLIFFRGGWCGYCSRHLSAIQEAKEDIEKLGFQIVAITPDQVSRLPKTIKKTDLDYTLLSDSKADAIQKFGLAYTVEGAMQKKFDQYKISLKEWSGEKHNMLPVPAVYIINEGEVLFNYVNPNYSKRLETSTLISLLKTL